MLTWGKSFKLVRVIGLTLFSLSILSLSTYAINCLYQPPYEVWGTAKIDGISAPDGITVDAYIDGILLASTQTMFGYYIMDISCDNPGTLEKDGGNQGDIIVFSLNDTNATTTGTWTQSIINRVDIDTQTAEVISITLSGYPLTFGSNDPGTENNPGQDANAPYNIAVNAATNVNVDVQFKGSDFLGQDVISVGNVAFDDDQDVDEILETNLPQYNMSLSYVTYFSDVTPSSNLNVWYWIDIPSSQPVGTYNSTFYVNTIKHI